jgi:hypothetical protein
MIDAMESRGRVFSAANEIAKTAVQAKAVRRNQSPDA